MYLAIEMTPEVELKFMAWSGLDVSMRGVSPILFKSSGVKGFYLFSKTSLNSLMYFYTCPEQSS